MPACHAGDRRFESGRVRQHRFSLRPVRPPGRGVPCLGSRMGSLAASGRMPSMRRLTENRLPVLVVAGPARARHRRPDVRWRARVRRPAPASRPHAASPSGARSARPLATATAAVSAEPTAARPRRPPRRRPDAGTRPGRDRAGHPVPGDGHGDQPQARSPTSSPAPASATTRSTLVADEADAILAALGVRATSRSRPASCSPKDAATLTTGPRQEPQAPGVPARR